MKHIFIPTGGLANRVRVILSALQYQHDSGQNVSVWWIPDNGLAARFDQLFIPVSQIHDLRPCAKYLFRLAKFLYRHHCLFGRVVYTDAQYYLVNQFVTKQTGGVKSYFVHLIPVFMKEHFLPIPMSLP